MPTVAVKLKRRPMRPKRIVPRAKPVRPYRKRRQTSFRTNIPSVMKVALKYTEIINIALAVGNGYTTVQTFRPNDVYDLNFSGAGHQAMMRDQWYTLYEFCRCIGFTFRVIAYTDSASPVELFMLPTTTSATISFEQATESKGVQTRVLTQAKPVVLSFRNYVDRALGNKKHTVYTDDSFKQPPSGALVDKATCWVQFGAISRASSTANVWFRVSIVQYCSFVEPLYQNQS